MVDDKALPIGPPASARARWDRAIQLQRAFACFETEITKLVPDNICLKDRADGEKIAKPGDKPYPRIRRRFIEDIVSVPTQSIMSFMGYYNDILQHDPDLFFHLYSPIFEQRGKVGQLNNLKNKFPHIHQSELITIISPCGSHTLISYRIDDLCALGLLCRETNKPPYPKRIWLTDAGARLMSSVHEAQDRCFYGPKQTQQSATSKV
jgi:hypothetical protein